MPSGRDSARQALLPHQLCWEQEASPAVQGETKDEEMPCALQDRMGVIAADSSSILGKAKGTRLQSQVVHGQSTQKLLQQGFGTAQGSQPLQHSSAEILPQPLLQEL